MANTFELIASSTVGSGGASSIDFTSIPSTFTDLCLIVSSRVSTNPNDNYLISFNGSTTSFSSKQLVGTGSAASSESNGSFPRRAGITDGSGRTASTFGNGQIYIPNYAGSNYKSYGWESVEENNATAAVMTVGAGLWSSTSAINQVTLTVESGGTFVQYSTAYLYGVKSS